MIWKAIRFEIGWLIYNSSYIIELHGDISHESFMVVYAGTLLVKTHIISASLA